ncbi:MAG: sensor histidine kinase [Candidatus Krumholzibacteriia bacterium]
MEKQILVLVVEDSITVQKMVQQMLRDDPGHRFEVLACDNLGDAATILVEHPVDVIILDLTLPECTGVETVSRVRAMDPDVPIVVFTGCEDDNLAMAAMHMGADDFLVKREVRQGSLLSRTLRYAIEKKRARLALDRYALEMERLAEARARQLLHQDRLATIGTMSAGVAHEIKNPLAFMSGNAQALKDLWPEVESCLGNCLEQGIGDGEEITYILEEVPSMLADIQSGTERILEIIEGLKNFARKNTSETSAATVEGCIDGALLLCRNLLKYGIEVEKDFTAGEPSMPLQPQRMTQVFVNLFTNAAQAMDGKGTLAISTAIEGEELIVRVRDSGPGIPDETLESIWEPFFTTKPEGVGTGLGLSICRKIIEEHRGTLTVANRDSGAEFTLTLPLETEMATI